VISPGDECLPSGEPAPFIARWNTLVKALIVEPSVKLVARTAVDYGIYDGTGIYPGNERLARQTGYDARTISHAWAVLRALGMAQRDGFSHWTATRRTADMYALEIPDDWRFKPIYGPKFGRFHCEHCGRAFNPRPGTHVRKDGTIGFYLRNMTFCADPGRPKRTAAEKARKTRLKPVPQGCFEAWGGSTRWIQLGDDAWKLFQAARSDDWP